MPGTVTSKAEVVQVTPFGVWLAYGDTELYMDHDRFPWFRHATIDQIFNITEVGEISAYCQESVSPSPRSFSVVEGPGARAVDTGETYLPFAGHRTRRRPQHLLARKKLPRLDTAL